MKLKTNTLFKICIICISTGMILASVLLSQPIVAKKSNSTSPDYIIILGGGGGVRINHFVKEKYKKYPEIPVIYTGGNPFYGKPNAHHMAAYAKSIGVTSPVIHIDTSKSTFDDALHTRQYFRNHNIIPKSILVITSDYHTGRSFWVFKKVFPETNIFIEPAPDKLLTKKWWADYNMAQYVLEEKSRFLFYRLVVFLWPSIIKV